MMMTQTDPIDCRQCVWDQTPDNSPHCPDEAECALKKLVETAEVRQGSLTSARFGGFSLTSAMQPIYSLAHERVIAYEALVRGKTGNETISPWEIFSSVNSFEEAVQLDRLCRAVHLHNYRRHIDDEVWLFLNINPKVIIGGQHFGSFFQQLLESTDIAPERIVVEILEHTIDDEQLLADTVQYYRNMGCLIALDDFGSGHSNFERIIRLKPDIVKLDSTMIRQANENPLARRIMPNLIAMLHEAGCLVLMEGIETQEEALIALECNVDFVQGFYFAKPTAPHRLQPPQSDQFSHLNRLYQARFKQDSQHNRQKLKHYIDHLAQGAAFYAAGIDLEIACRQLLDSPRVERCFVLDVEGRQLGDNLYPEHRRQQQGHRFNPLADIQGANWHRKPYFRKAIVHPGKVKVTRPYLSSTGANMCITLSICIELEQELCILCCDLSHGQAEANEAQIRTA